MMIGSGIARIRPLALLTGLVASPLVGAQVSCGGMIFADGFDPAAPASVLINEIASDPIPPGDWVELHNPGGAAIDIGGWSISDNVEGHAEFLPGGTVVPARCYFTYYPTFGLGSADSAVLRTPAFQLVDSYSWTAHPVASYSRCPNGSGPFVNAVIATPGLANSCP